MNSAADQVFNQPLEPFLIQGKVLTQWGNHGRDNAAQRARQFRVQDNLLGMSKWLENDSISPRLPGPEPAREYSSSWL